MPEKQTNKERLKDITDSIEKGIQELFQSDKYAQYLRTMSRFHRYSVNIMDGMSGQCGGELTLTFNPFPFFRKPQIRSR